MHELQRQAFLQALGIDSYVSRGQLPGAAPSRRLALVRPATAPLSETVGEVNSGRTASPAGKSPLPPLDLADSPRSARSSSRPERASKPLREAPPMVRMRIAAQVCGGYLWLEDLGDLPLASEQVALVAAMAHALSVATGLGSDESIARPDLAQFDWPMHNNRQLDNSEEAARAGLAAFVGRRIEQHTCRGLIVLGSACAAWIADSDYACPVVQTVSTGQMLADPAAKPGVWQDLRALWA